MTDLLLSGGHLGLGAAVDDGDFLRSQALGRAGGIHGDVAATEDRDTMTVVDRGAGVVTIVRLHQVAARQILIGREDPDVVLPLDVEEAGKPGAAADEDGVKAILLHEFLEGPRLSNQEVAANLHPHVQERLQLMLDDRLGEPELGNPVDQYPTGFVQCLEHHHLVARSSEVRGSRDAGRTAADDRDPLAGLRSHGRNDFLIVLTGPVGDKALDSSDGDRTVDILEGLAHRTRQLALALLWADTTTDRGQQAALLDDGGGLSELAFGGLGDERRNVNANRTAGNTRFVLALQAAQRLCPDLGLGIPEGHLMHIGDPDHRILARHALDRDLNPILGLQLPSLILLEDLLCLCVQCFSCLVHDLMPPLP